MSQVVALASPALPTVDAELAVPAINAEQGERAATRFVEFFTANIRNRTHAGPMAMRCRISSPGASGSGLS